MAAAIEFKLFAPYNQESSLMGCFSNWEEIPMEKQEDGYFRTQVELEDGVYQYKFRVRSKSWFLEPDQWVDIVDPYATDIDDPSQNGLIRIKDGDRIVDTYVWRHDDKPLPADRELVIYEMHVADFSGGEADPLARGKYEHVVEKLDYLVELGVNAIELMPLNVAGPKPFYTIAEYVPEDTSITNLDGPMDGCWHDSFYHCIIPQLCGDNFDLERLKDVIDGKRQGFMGATNVVNYLSNHDHNHVFAELGDREIFGEAAFKRAKLGAVVLMTAVGVPLIWMGDEFGEYKSKTIEQAKIDWTLLGNDSNKGLWEYYKGLINLRENNQALYTENIDFFHEDLESKVFAYTRWNDEGSRVVVVVNWSENYLAGYSVPHFPANGTWHEWTGDYDVESGDDNIMIDLPEYEAKVFVWQ
jgi:1,4-alpha-glucan branching enzyme